MVWRPAGPNAKYGIAIYNFTANGPHQISLSVGEAVHIIEENSGWYRGFPIRNKTNHGVFPANYIHLKECTVKCGEGFGEEIVLSGDVIGNEITNVLHIWNAELKSLFKERKTESFTVLRKHISDLIGWRRQIISGTLPEDQLRDIRCQASLRIDTGNRMLNLDMVPRNEAGDALDADSIGIIDLFKVHQRSAADIIQNTRNAPASTKDAAPSSQAARRAAKQPSGASHHLLFEMKNFVCSVGEDSDVHISLYNA
eukprot:Opistho-2@15258